MTENVNPLAYGPQLRPERAATRNDRVIVAGGASNTLDLLRLATVRSDDVVLVMERLDDGIVRYAGQFAVEIRHRRPSEIDFQGAAAALLSTGDIDLENRLVLAAHRHGVPVHVADRFVLSDFSMLAFLEHDPSSMAKAPGDTDVRAA